MPTMKSHKASQHRVRVTAKGKILRRQCGVRHFLTNRTPKRRRNLCGPATTIAKGYVRKIRFAHQGRVGRKTA